ncbi:MAG: Gfo/Idh/MocA family oxidoreductase [Chloroflexota bacterium]|nr:Gfo/Idh/MocA family oxidoreductase [Chloroflexota bacterium]
MAKKLRGGLIGCGSIGKVFAEAVGEIEGMDMVAFCSRTKAKAERYNESYHGEYSTTNVQDIFDDPSIDAVYISTWHDSHADLCIRAAKAGKHILVEKPLALTVEECQAVGRAVEESGIRLMVAFKMRYYDMILKARELIPNPVMVTMQMMDNRWPDDFWASDPITGGGNVLSQGCHSCDILRFVAGRDPIEVYAAGDNYYTSTGVVDNLCATFRFEGGIAGNWVQGDANCPPLTSKFYLQLFAENKSVTLSDRLCTLTYNEAGQETQVFKGTESGFVEENRAFIDCLINGTRPPIDHIDGLMATLMVLQAFNSLKSGRPEPIASVLRDL